MILNKAQILSRIKESSMIKNIIDINSQLQPVGVDLTVSKIYRYNSIGTIDFDNSKRILSEKYEMPYDENNRYYLKQGCYQVELNETLNIPLDIVAKTTSRSSLQRCGATIDEGFFDPGFCGSGFSILNVYNPHGLYLYKNAKVCQMSFHTTELTEPYRGIYQEKSINHNHNANNPDCNCNLCQKS